MLLQLLLFVLLVVCTRLGVHFVPYLRYRLILLRGVLSAVAALGIGGAAVAVGQAARSPRPPVPGAPAGVTAFVDVAVIPLDTERVLPHQTVLVQHGWITAVGPVATIKVPVGALRIDGRGKYLIPSLADMHAHVRIGRADLGLDSITVERRLFLLAAEGIATVRDLTHEEYNPTPQTSGEAIGVVVSGPQILRLRARAAAGALWSPRLYVADRLGGTVQPDGNIAPFTLADVAPAVLAYKAAGYDFIKTHPGDNHGPVFDSLAAMAHRVGLPLEGHTVVPLQRALQTYHSIEHLSGYLPGAMDGGDALDPNDTSGTLATKMHALAVATARAGVWNCPTLYNETLNLGISGLSPEGRRELVTHQQLVKALQDAGAGLLLGTDRSQFPAEVADLLLGRRAEVLQRDSLTRKFDWLYGDPTAVHHELEALVAAGLTPYQALVTGTRNVAQFYHELDRSGTVTVGKRADLVLLTGDPLAQIQHTQHPAGVMLGGRWLSRADIDRRIAAMKDSVAHEGGAWPTPVGKWNAYFFIGGKLPGMPSGQP